MYQNLHVIDFHSHFPTSRPWFAGMGEGWQKKYVDRVGERRAKIAREHALAYNKDWRLAWDFPPSEQAPPADEAQADRWAEEIDRYGLRVLSPVAATITWPRLWPDTPPNSSALPTATPLPKMQQRS